MTTRVCLNGTCAIHWALLSSQTFEQSLFKLFIEGKITQDEAMTNADSATNMLWLINQATAGEISGQPLPPSSDAPEPEKSGTSEKKFNDFKIDVNA